MSSEIVQVVTNSVEKATENIDKSKVVLTLGVTAIAAAAAVAGYALYKGGVVKAKFWNAEFEADTRDK